MRPCPWIAVGLTVAALAASLLLYSRLDEQVPIHWNIRGEVDDYGSKNWAAFLTPAIMAVFVALIWVLPWISPQQYKLDSFRGTFEFTMLLVIVFMAYVHGLMLWAALAPQVDVSRALLGGISLLFAMLGGVLSRVKRNFWVGVRTPWTLASETVWVATHRLAAKLFVAAGVLGLVGLFLPLSQAAATGVFLSVIGVAAIVPVVYSLVLYKRLERQGQV